MTRSKSARLLAPAAIVATGSILAGAVAIGHTWGDALATEVVTLLLSVGYYFLTGSDSDVGAIYGHRADERQRFVLMQATRLAFTVMLGAAFVCAAITIAMGKNYWQADVIGSLGAISYLLGMSIYGAHEDESPIDRDRAVDDDGQREARSQRNIG